MKIGIFRRLNPIINLFPGQQRRFLYRMLGMKIGEGTVLSPNLFLDDPERIVIGRNCFLNQNVQLYTGAGSADITIGDRVWIGMNTTILCPSHELGGPEQRAGKPIYQPVHIGSGCWIGADVTILPGVTIGRGCVIGGGTVIVRDCEENSMYVGSPARCIRRGQDWITASE